MKTIWKYQLDVTDRQRLYMPKGAEILCVQNQGGVLCLWAKVDSGAKPEERVIVIVGTGRPIHRDLKYIGTVQQVAFVWHVFEITRERACK